ncbi:hypothetical protein C4J92_0297 [Pseudomonas sp. R3-18-08]|nr:hypothetical protein C4J92_0297 [Pseudomonas sp. R3-18-08]AZF19052.1 hypothetical protein C4J91_0268 [Pseudomonas sp. R3-52-08]AZF24479.1 hypothetical protein C4J90_0273 [Pseudomonas sp. R2-60-08W]AZF35094.1 hypothetical protein C4J88_0279 [Pseudomonas sp. R4-39-08]AZF45553.1 hypothetical protein C4J86_0285 [Pseudomonas sp. R2-7-07]
MKIARSQLSRRTPVNIERTQYIGHYGITFTVLRLIALPANRHALANLCLLEAGTFANELRQRLVDLYDKMLARDLPCKITIGISKPITRQHADLLNIRGEIVAGLISGAVSAPMSLASPAVGLAAGAAVGLTIKGLIRSYHAGDVVIGIDAQVNGGIGPQRSLSSMVRQFQGG